MNINNNNIGSEKSFVEMQRWRRDCGVRFIGVKDSAHSEMNGVYFETWWEKKVLPSLPDKSVVVNDNAK